MAFFLLCSECLFELLTSKNIHRTFIINCYHFIIIIIIIIIINSERKLNKYRPLDHSLSSSYQEVKFVNVSMSALGALDSSCDSLMEMLEDLDFAEKLRKRLISKIMNIAIRCTYFIFCRRNKEWTDPNLMDF